MHWRKDQRLSQLGAVVEKVMAAMTFDAGGAIAKTAKRITRSGCLFIMLGCYLFGNLADYFFEPEKERKNLITGWLNRLSKNTCWAICLSASE